MGDKTNLIDTLKRPSNYNLSEFDTRTTKKLHVNDENSCSEPFCLKSIEFKKDNMKIDKKEDKKF